MRAFAILYRSLGLIPSVDVFLYFFEAKDPGKKLWVSLNGVAERVLSTLFQQLYEGVKNNFFKVRCKGPFSFGQRSRTYGGFGISRIFLSWREGYVNFYLGLLFP